MKSPSKGYWNPMKVMKIVIIPIVKYTGLAQMKISL